MPDARVVIVQSDDEGYYVSDTVEFIHFDVAILYCRIWVLLGVVIVQSVNADNVDGNEIVELTRLEDDTCLKHSKYETRW